MLTKTDTFVLAVVGSRRYRGGQTMVREVLADFLAAAVCEVRVVSGGCRGPDTWAVAEARETGCAVQDYLPDLTGLGPAAPRWAWTRRYHERNERLAEACDGMLAFVADDRRGGTEHAIACARRLGKRVVVVPGDGVVLES